MAAEDTSNLCQICEEDEAARCCEDCVSGSQYYCNDCAAHHLKIKANAKHRIKDIGAKSHDKDPTFEEFLDILGFSKYFFQEKLSLNNALRICNKDYNACETLQPEELLLLILQKIMACNHQFRKVFLRKEANQKPFPIVYHPMDALIALLSCCDNILLQDVYSRMHACQIAIPLLLPNPSSTAEKITFPLWAMRSIVKQWRYRSSATSEEYIPCEGRLVDCPLHIVSFMRLSKVKSLYKSKILNSVISDSIKHQYFFDYECPGSDTKRCYVDGLVEIAWYLPQGNKNDLFSSPVTFCNLRGDSRNHPAQYKILMTISHVCFLFVKNEDIDMTLMEMLSQFCQNSSQKKVFLVMNIACPSNKEIPSNCSVLTLRTGLHKITEIIRHKINESLKEVLIPHDSAALSSSCRAACSESNHVIVDEISDQFISSSKKNADEIMRLVRQKKKKELVPLQGENYWQAWAKENKKQKRKQLADMGEMSESKFYSVQEKLKNNIMEEMLKISYGEAVKKFIDALVNTEASHRIHFLHWLRMLLDDYSREVLPELHAKCALTRAMLAKSKNSKENNQTQLQTTLSDTQLLQKRLHQENQELINASFGLEHFFREMGVVYEIVSANKESTPTLWSQVEHFPKLAVDLLLTGCAFELLDGDAAHIAINWVKAIFEKLKLVIGEKSKLFVLSVLGIQSSGKSTLLNTAFGLRFPVSAGRCTRGAFFQLLKCDESSFKGACDYMLVIDTEGLRAPELEYKGTQKHDNELATLVIGLASLTIVNVFGEVSVEMDDILQTTVHAFLRMTQADLRPSCLLVKHHVDEVTANKGIEGLCKLQEKLDDMTLSAAKQELCEGLYKKFGNPPMSPIDPKYSEAAQNLKMAVINNILVDCSNSQSQNESGMRLMCTLGEFQLRIKTLWDSVLRENFIFSFKNALEIAAFNELDRLSVNWSWSLESCVQKWELQTRTLIKGGKIETNADEQKQIKEAENNLDHAHEKIQQEIKDLFEKHEFAYTLSYMRSMTEAKFRKFVENHKQNALKFCKENMNREKLNQKVKNETQYHEKIQHAVKDLVASMPNIAKDTKMTDQFMSELNEHFSIKWHEWMQEIEKDAPLLHEADIENEILQTIYTQCGIEYLHALIRDGVKLQPLSIRAKTTHLYMDVVKEKHINNVGGVRKRIKKMIWKDDHQHKYEIIKERTEEILQNQKQYLDTICQTEDEYNVRQIIQIVSFIQKEIEQLQEEVNECFTFTAEFRVDVILMTCGYAMRVFEILQEKSHDNHPITYFKSRRDMYCNNFISQCCQGVNAIQTAIIAADNFAKVVIKSVKSQLKEQMVLTLEIKEHDRMIFQTKKSLKRAVLLRLLEERKFNLYTTHLENINQSYFIWITRFVQEHCESIGEDGNTLIVSIAADELKAMQASVEHAVKKHYNIPASQSNEQWLNAFHQELKNLSIIKQDLMKFVCHQNIEFERFKTEFSVKFKQQISEFLEEIRNDQSILDEVKQIVAGNIHKRRTGCCAQCPFCKEQCEKSEPSHEGKHMCTIHRPQCLGGWRFTESQEMILYICNDDIRGNRKFLFRKINKYVPYKDYQKYFEDWFIDKDRCHTPRYWQWFIGEYTKEIADHYKMKEPVKEKQTVAEWKNHFFTKDAKADVEEKYKNYEE